MSGHAVRIGEIAHFVWRFAAADRATCHCRIVETVLRHHPDWCQASCNLYGQDKAKSRSSITLSAVQSGGKDNPSAGYGGHFRAAQGFRYMGEPAA